MKLKFCLIVISLFAGKALSAQDYFNLIVPFIEELNPNPGNIEILDNQYLISTIHTDALSSIASSLVIIDDTNLNQVEYLTIDSFRISIKTFLIDNDEKLLMSGKNTPSENGELKIKAFDETLETYSTFGNYNLESDVSFPGPSIAIDGKFYCANMTQNTGSIDREFLLKKIDSAGIEKWSVLFSEEDSYTHCWDLDSFLDNTILISTGVYRNGVKSQLFKIDTSGNIIWSYVSEESADSGTVGHYIAPLSNESIVLATTLDKHNDVDFIVNDWNPFPPKFTWIDNDGQEVFSQIMTSEFLNSLFIVDLESGIGDYFFGYGSWTDPDSNLDFGWLFKMNNNGEILWNKRFQHPDNLTANHIINDIIELDNGDLLLMGRFNIPGMKSNIWLLKVNENGCFGSESCGDYLTSNYEMEWKGEEFPLLIFPNPTNDQINIVINDDITPDKIEIYNQEGENVKIIDPSVSHISVSELKKGVYFLRIYSDGVFRTERIVVSGF